MALACTLSHATERSYAAKAEFKRLNPCPANGNKRGPCPGYVVDHVEPLCNGGADHHANMAWSTSEDAAAKDKEEVKLCRMIKAKQLPAYADRADLCRALEPLQWPLLTKALCDGNMRGAGNN